MGENLEPSKFLSVSQLLESHPLASWVPGAKNYELTASIMLYPKCKTFFRKPSHRALSPPPEGLEQDQDTNCNHAKSQSNLVATPWSGCFV